MGRGLALQTCASGGDTTCGSTCSLATEGRDSTATRPSSEFAFTKCVWGPQVAGMDTFPSSRQEPVLVIQDSEKVLSRQPTRAPRGTQCFLDSPV